MKTVLTLDDIKRLVDIPQLLQDIETGFVWYSEGRVEVPPVGFLHIDEPPGDVHIKYGYVHGDDYYVLKVASAFTDASNRTIADGVILVFNSRTGAVEFVLMDEGWLTDIRTAAAGAVAAKQLANSTIDSIGIIGTGVQARLQLELLRNVTDCKQCIVWGRDSAKVDQMINELSQRDSIRSWGIQFSAVDSVDSLVSQSSLIVSTTASRTPLIEADLVRPGTHITAMGSDDHGKQELSSALVAKADILVADSKSQCIDHGECGFAIREELIDQSAIAELGQVIKDPSAGRTNTNQITIADLTGVAVQDIQIAKMIARAHKMSVG